MLIEMNETARLEEAQRLGNEIAVLSAHIEVATARLLELIREFDALCGWGNGFASCAHWLNYRVGIGLHAAREQVRTARALARLPLIAQAFARGVISYSKVRALTRVATPQVEERLLKFAAHGTAAHVERLASAWHRVDRAAEHQLTVQRMRSRSLEVHQDDDGMVVIRGRLTPEVGAVLRQALDAARDRMYAKARVDNAEGIRPSHGQQQADALGMIAEAALRHDLDPGASGARYQVVVHVDAAVLADPGQPGQSVLEDGPHVPAGTCERLACDASRVVMRHDADGRITEVGVRTRTVPPALRRALERRDHGCRFPGCGLRYTQGHHIKHWAQGGPTKLSNLVLLCRRHHRSIHEEGFQVQRLADGELQFRHPSGWLIPEVPEPPSVPADAGETLRSQNAAASIHVDGTTLRPDWDGTGLNVGWAIDVMHPRAIGH
jgi:5-methylcytosine-specific restriction endonuclease McrA